MASTVSHPAVSFSWITVDTPVPEEDMNTDRIGSANTTGTYDGTKVVPQETYYGSFTKTLKHNYLYPNVWKEMADQFGTSWPPRDGNKWYNVRQAPKEIYRITFYVSNTPVAPHGHSGGLDTGDVYTLQLTGATFFSDGTMKFDHPAQPYNYVSNEEAAEIAALKNDKTGGFVFPPKDRGVWVVYTKADIGAAEEFKRNGCVIL